MTPLKTFLLFGDSIMSGVYPDVVGGEAGAAYSLATHLVQQERNVIIKNMSSPGHAIGGAQHSFANGVELMREFGGMFSAYDGVIIQAGTNDFGRGIPIADTLASLTAILQEAQLGGRKVLVMDSLWRWNEATPNSQGYTLGAYRWNVAITCNQYPDVAHFASRTGSVFDNSSASTLFSADEVAAGHELHLNTAGHRAYADWMIQRAAGFGLF